MIVRGLTGCDNAAAERRQCGGFRDTPVVRRAWEVTRNLARILEAALVLFQCPASFGPTAQNLASLRRFFERIDRGGVRLGWEPRGPGWTDAVARPLCRDLDLVHVVDPFQRRPLRGAPRYFRLHGIGGYGHVYSDDELRRLVDLCDTKAAYCLFNNVAMLEDARRFLALTAAGARGYHAPPR